MKIQNFLFPLLLLPALLAAQPRRLYVDWHHRSNQIELGEYKDAKLRRRCQVRCPIEQLTEADLARWLGHPLPDAEALLYFHCLWGQQIHFHRKSLRSLGKVWPGRGDSSAIISFVWHAGSPSYKRAWRHAAGKGEPLGPLATKIGRAYGGKVDVLCHSMGNRLFEGVVRKAGSPASDTLFRRAVLFSADLDAKTMDPDLRRLRGAVRSVAVFQHRRDLLLLFSSWIHRCPRLGRSGPLGVPEYRNMEVFDMSAHTRGLVNHTHLDKKWVQAQIRAFYRMDAPLFK